MLGQLAYEAALRALDKQVHVLEELRRRTGNLLAASALSVSFLGQSAFRRPALALAIVALAAFVLAIACRLFILVPRAGRFAFSLSGNDAAYQPFVRAKAAVAALAVEIVALVGLVSDTLV